MKQRLPSAKPKKRMTPNSTARLLRAIGAATPWTSKSRLNPPTSPHFQTTKLWSRRRSLQRATILPAAFAFPILWKKPPRLLRTPRLHRRKRNLQLRNLQDRNFSASRLRRPSRLFPRQWNLSLRYTRRPQPNPNRNPSRAHRLRPLTGWTLWRPRSRYIRPADGWTLFPKNPAKPSRCPCPRLPLSPRNHTNRNPRPRNHSEPRPKCRPRWTLRPPKIFFRSPMPFTRSPLSMTRRPQR